MSSAQLRLVPRLMDLAVAVAVTREVRTGSPEPNTNRTTRLMTGITKLAFHLFVQTITGHVASCDTLLRLTIAMGVRPDTHPLVPFPVPPCFFLHFRRII